MFTYTSIMTGILVSLFKEIIELAQESGRRPGPNPSIAMERQNINISQEKNQLYLSAGERVRVKRRFSFPEG